MKIIVKPKHSNITKGGEKRMRYSKIILAFGVIAFVLATLITSRADENVRNTKHNLAANPNILAGGTTEVCVFCHTPHGGDTNVGGGAAPLWNRQMQTIVNNNYQMYTSPNFDNKETGAGNRVGKPKGVSLACLSCHDGTLAFDALINFQGSGAGDESSINIPDSNFVSNEAFSPNAGPFLNLGYPLANGLPDLSNDHPISMEICSSGNPPAEFDPQFKQACANSTSPTNNPNIIRISRTGDFPSDIRNVIRAYRSVGTDGGWYIECASCHNPHEASSPNDPTGANASLGTAKSRFLRYPSDTIALPIGDVKTALEGGDRNAGSLLCLSCHQK